MQRRQYGFLQMGDVVAWAVEPKPSGRNGDYARVKISERLQQTKQEIFSNYFYFYFHSCERVNCSTHDYVPTWHLFPRENASFGDKSCFL